MNSLIPTFWAGTQASFDAYFLSVKHLMESGQLEKRADYMDPNQDPADCPRLFEMQGEIGVISIKGPLNNSDSWVNEWMGATGYPEIRAALIHAANSPDVKAIALDIQSGGGAVSGCGDTADLIRTIDSKVKPVYAFSDGQIASAAYRLGVSARTLQISAETEAGSIGVLMVHREMSKMMADMGITATVIRSGKWKALGTAVEPLSDTAREVFQSQVDTLNGLFVDYVAACKKKTSAEVEAKMGQGRVFIGQDAVDIGLVDSVANYDAFMSEVSRGIAFLEKSPQYPSQSLKGMQLKTALIEPQTAAQVTGDVTAVAAAAAADVAAESAPAKEAADTGVVALLQGQLATAQAQVLQLSVDLSTTKAALVTAEASAEKLRPVVRAAVGQLRVATGGAAAGVEALTDDSLMAEHAGLSAQFSAKFPTGGVAVVTPTASSGSASDDAVDPMHQARLAATRNSK